MTRRDLYREFLSTTNPPDMVDMIINGADYLCPGELDVVIVDRAAELKRLKAAHAESKRLSLSALREDLAFFHRVRQARDN